MAQVRKYAQLPDLDNAPDIYETPDLTDDASTLQTSTTARSASSSPSDSDDQEPSSGLVRGRLHPDRARNHFLPSRVDAQDADFSDRLSTKKQSYKVSSRRRRKDGAVIEHEDEDEDGYSDEDGEEGLERRMARLRREVEEVRAEFARRKEEAGVSAIGEGQDEDDAASGIAALSKALDSVRDSQRNAVSAHARLAKQLSKPLTKQLPSASVDDRAQSTLQAAEQPDAETLTRIAAFDARLADLERALGLGALDLNESTASILPLVPTLSQLDKQMHLLTSSDTLPQLDALTAKLSAVQAAPGKADTAQRSGERDGEAAPSLTSEDLTKLRALYALLPTLTSMSPELPAVLSRLRSLREIHAGAAKASTLLDELEKRQEETEKDIEAWKNGLEKVEEAVKQAEGGMRGNVEVVEGWVKELEDKLSKAAR